METKINIFINKKDLETLPGEDYEAIERAQDGDFRLYRIRPVIARFLVDEGKIPLPHAAAMRELGKIPMNEWPSVIDQFIQALKGTAIPNENGNP